jgi:large subunit ribosomal protein L3
MIQTLIGKKTDQMQSFLENGARIPVTEIAVSENVVLQVKTAEKEAYSAVQLGVGAKKKPNKALLGHAKKAGKENAPLKIKEVSVDSSDAPVVGDAIAVDAVFKPGDLVQVTGTSKGKGFAGVVKRHNFSGGPKTHGQSDRHRAPGSIGQGTTPGRVYKGKRMAGRMGSDTVTVKNLTVVDVDLKTGRLFVSGLVPGHKNSWLYITKIGEDKKYVPLLESEVKKAEAEAQAQVEPEVVAEPVAEVEVADTKEVKSDAEEGELKTPDAEEKAEVSGAAEENVAEEKKEEVAVESNVEEPVEDTVEGVQAEEKAAEAKDANDTKEEKENA